MHMSHSFETAAPDIPLLAKALDTHRKVHTATKGHGPASCSYRLQAACNLLAICLQSACICLVCSRTAAFDTPGGQARQCHDAKHLTRIAG
jgi:hypothetical protein